MAAFIKSKKFLLILFLLFFISSSTALALEIDWPRTPRPGGITLTDDSDVGDMVQYFYEWAIILGGLATFVSLVSAGFKYLSSMGRPEAMKEARSQITSAFAGLVLLLSAWLILNTINPELTTFRRTSFDLKFSLDKYTSLALEELPGCDYVILYRLEDFGGGEIPIPGKESITKLTTADDVKEFLPSEIGSVKAFTKSPLPDTGCCDDNKICNTSPPCDCGGSACGCVLQLFAIGDVACGDDLGDTGGWDNVLRDRESKGQKISCVKLSGTTNQCRKEDPVTGEYGVSEDTAWGDDDYNCGETKKDMHDRRCLDGRCITCKGTIFKDGCGGCSNKKMVSGYTGNSEFACWYLGVKSDDGEHCGTACKKYAGKDSSCVEEDWNDDSRCTICEKLSPVFIDDADRHWKCHKDFLFPGTPWYRVQWLMLGWPLSCSYRISTLKQQCGDISTGGGARLCVCDR